MVNVDLVYNSTACLLGDLGGPLKRGGANSVDVPHRAFFLDDGHDPEEIRGGASSLSTTAQGEATTKMADRLRNLLSRVILIACDPLLLYLFVCLLVILL